MRKIKGLCIALSVAIHAVFFASLLDISYGGVDRGAGILFLPADTPAAAVNFINAEIPHTDNFVELKFYYASIVPEDTEIETFPEETEWEKHFIEQNETIVVSTGIESSNRNERDSRYLKHIALSVKRVPVEPAESFFSPPAIGDFNHTNVKPAYPYIARKMGYEGVVLLNVEVAETGFPDAVVIERSSGYPALDNAAVVAVAKWKFVPAIDNGVAVKSRLSLPIRFKLDG